MTPKERLEKVDDLLQKNWQSFYDFAKAIYGRSGETYFYEKEFKTNARPSIVLDFRLIQDIWYCAHHNALIPKGNSTADKNPLRAEIIAEIFESKTQKQFPSGRAPELFKEKDVYYANPKVTFYRYKNRKYSIFTSGDYDKYVAFKTKEKNKKSLEDTLHKSVTDSEVNQAQYDQGFVPEPVVSEQIKRSIRLQDELREFAQGSKKIVDSLLQSISSESDQKKRRWVQKTVNYYRNILELVKNPLSNYNPREVADRIHDFAFFLASENQYHLLGNRFDEALTIYQKLRREQRHLVEDIEQGLITGEEADIDVPQTKEQMAQDDEAVASILLSMARVCLDSGDMDKAGSLLDQANALVNSPSLVKAQIDHLASIMEGLSGNWEAAFSRICEASEMVRALGLADLGEGMAIQSSKAELLQRRGETEAAKAIFERLIKNDSPDPDVQEVKTAVYLHLANIYLFGEEMAAADNYVTHALAGFQKLYDKEPDKHLPNLLTAKYIKGLVLMHQGDREGSIAMLEEARAMVPENRPDLLTLCGAELTEIDYTLRSLRPLD